VIVTDGKLKVGDVGLTKVRGAVGKLIRVMQWLNGSSWHDSEFEHSFLLTDVNAIGRMWGFEAQPGGAHFFDVKEKYGNEEIVWIRPTNLSAQQQLDLVKQADILKGTPYSFLEYGALLTHRLHLPLPGVKKYVNSTRHLICSQIIAELYRRISIELFGGEWPGYVTPANYYTVYGDTLAQPTA